MKDGALNEFEKDVLRIYAIYHPYSFDQVRRAYIMLESFDDLEICLREAFYQKIDLVVYAQSMRTQ